MSARGLVDPDVSQLRVPPHSIAARLQKLTISYTSE